MPPTQSTLTSTGQSDEDESESSTTEPGHTSDCSSTTTSPSESKNQSDESTADTSSGPPSDLDEDQITTLDATAEIDEWTASCKVDGLDYAFLHVQVDVYRTLTETWWGLRVTTREKIIENSRNSYSGSFGQRSVDPDDLIETIIDWVSEILSTPYRSPDEHDLPIGHHLRSIPNDRIRVFVSDAAVDFLTDRDIPIDALLETTHELPEVTPSSTYRDQVLKYYTARDEVKASRKRIRKLKQAVGAAFSISTGFGGSVPTSPPSEYMGFSPNDLQEELTAAREARQKAKSRRDSLHSDLDSHQTTNSTQLTDELKTECYT